MKKLLFVILLSISSLVHAQWIVIDYVPEKLAMLFIDKSTIQQVNQYTRVWTKVEFHTSSEMFVKQNVLSTRAYLEFDCREKKYRILSFQSFRNNNLNGFVYSDDKVEDWQFIAPQTAYVGVLENICKSK